MLTLQKPTRNPGAQGFSKTYCIRENTNSTISLICQKGKIREIYLWSFSAWAKCLFFKIGLARLSWAEFMI